MLSPILNVRVHAQIRIFSESRPNHISVVPLSVADASVVRFSTTAAVWYFDPPTDKQKQTSLSPGHLQSSLQRTLNSYPQWCGQLQWAVHKQDGDHTQRVGRLFLSYGAPTDPGVEFVIASSSKSMTALIPSPSERRKDSHGWDASQIPSVELLPSAELPLHDLHHCVDLPGMMVQITTFACGMVAVGIKMAHPLADAQTLTRFTHDWAATHRALLAGAPLPILSPVFDPQRLDRMAAGDIDATQPDAEIVKRARSLPMHCYDWWASSDGTLPKVQPDLEPARAALPGTPMPWSEWDTDAPVGHYLVHFSQSEVQGMWEQARSSSAPSTHAISHQDALAAHVWALINRARGLTADEEMVYLNMSLGIRNRISPPLSPNFLGSPLVLCRVSATGQEGSSEHPGFLATRIRSSLSLFDAPALSALLHDMAHDVGLVRLWHAFLGRRNVIVTSWVHQRLYDVDFGAGSTPRYVEAVMPSADGCVQIMEAPPMQEENGVFSSGASQGRSHWYDDGVDVSLHLADETIQNILLDRLLHKYSAPHNVP